MELALGRKSSFLEGCSRVFHSKDDNVLREQILPKVTRGDESVFNEFLRLLEYLDVGGKDLLIIDPYLFSPASCGNTDRFLKIIDRSNPSRIHAAYLKYDKSVFNQSSYDDFKYRLKEDISFSECNEDFSHDRFWICPDTRKGIVVGCSLHNIGDKLCYIGMLPERDIDTIMQTVFSKKWS